MQVDVISGNLRFPTLSIERNRKDGARGESRLEKVAEAAHG
jgi:hypothetical protein